MFQQITKKHAPDGSYSKLYLQARLFKYIKPYLFRAIMALVLTVPIGMADAAVAWSLKPFLDGMITKESIHTTSLVPLIILGVTFIQGILSYLSVYLNGWLGLKVVNDIRRDLFNKLQTMDVSYFDRTASGGIIQGYFNDPGILQNNLLQNVKNFFTRLFSTLSLMVVLALTSWKLAIVAIAVTVCILYPSTRLNKIIKQLTRQLLTTSTNMLSFYTETAQGIRIVKGYNLLTHRREKFAAFQKDMFNFSIKLTKTQGWLTPSMHMISAVGIAAIIWAGSQMVITDEITPGAFLSFLAALIMMYNPLKNLGNTFMGTLTSLLVAGRVFDILDTEISVKNTENAQELHQFKQDLRFENVTFEYVSGQPVLKNVSICFKKGETVAIVGGSGGGKSTIASLIPRFYDVTSGQITLDGIDIRNITMESLRENIAVVLQDNFLFDGTIEENIMLGSPNTTPHALADAIEKSYLTEFIQSLPEGLSTRIGERGVMLSGGQRQRVAIARALLKDSPIVIFDEATSALDNKSEAIVQQAMESLMTNRTVIVIAHRLSTIRNANRILALEHGEVVEDGTHESLMRENGIYAKLYKTQFENEATATDVVQTDEFDPLNSDEKQVASVVS